MAYVCSRRALNSLKSDVVCNLCGNLMPTLCTLGGCEHLFCRECCEALAGSCCPLCHIPTHVKEAQVNQQVSNIASLCLKLESILNGSFDEAIFRTDVDIREAQESTPRTEENREIDLLSKEKNKDILQRPSPCDQKQTSFDFSSSGHDQNAHETNQETLLSRVSRPRHERDRSSRNVRKRSVGSRETRSRSRTRGAVLEEEDGSDNGEQDDEGEQECKSRSWLRRREADVKIEGKQTSKSRRSSCVKRKKEMNEKCPNESQKGEEEGKKEKGTMGKESGGSARTLRTRRRKTGSEEGGSFLPMDQTTMTQFYDGSDCEETVERVTTPPTVSPKVVNSSGRKKGKYTNLTSKPNDQSTMTQFYDYDDEELELQGNENESKTKTTPSRRRSSSSESGKKKGTSAVKGDNSAHPGGTDSGIRRRKGKQNGGTVNTSPVFQSSPTKKKKDIGLRDATMKRNAKGETQLHVAAIKGDVVRVKTLLDAGANPNIRDNAGWTPLHETCNHGYVEIAELLLNHGAMINLPGLDNDTPLHDAVSNYRLGIVKLLVSKGADCSARNVHGHMPVDLARTEEMREALRTTVLYPSTVSVAVCEDDFQPLCFLGTALSRDQGIVLQKCASSLHAKVVDTYTPEVTHLITRCNMDGQCPRTLKYLHAVLAGKWIVTVDWLEMCLEYKQKVSEEPFEVPGSSTKPDSYAPMKGRNNKTQQLPGLFDGCQFYFHGPFNSPTPEKSELQRLVKDGGGMILSREPKLPNIDTYVQTVPYHAKKTSRLKDCGFFIIHDNKVSHPTLNSSRMVVLPASWIMDSIASFKLLDPE